MIDKLKGNYVQLALSKYGSYCLERCFNAADPFHKARARAVQRPRLTLGDQGNIARELVDPASKMHGALQTSHRCALRRDASHARRAVVVRSGPLLNRKWKLDLYTSNKKVCARACVRARCNGWLRVLPRGSLTRLAQLWESVMKDQRSAPRRFDDFLQELDGAGTPAAAAPAKRRRQE